MNSMYELMMLSLKGVEASIVDLNIKQAIAERNLISSHLKYLERNLSLSSIDALTKEDLPEVHAYAGICHEIIKLKIQLILLRVSLDYATKNTNNVYESSGI